MPGIVFFAPDSLLLQLVWVRFTGSCLICLVLHQKPFKTPAQNKAIVVEELAILVLTYHIPCFTDYIADEEVRSTALGISFISVAMCTLIVNYAFRLRIMCKDLTREIRRRKQLRKSRLQSQAEIRPRFDSAVMKYR